MTEQDKRQVKIRLTTRHEDLKVPETPLYVPVSLKRYGLSEIVNQLLQLEKPIPFDFLAEGELLKSSLDEYLTAQGLSSELTVTLEYTKSVLPPSFLASFPHEDWISSVQFQPKKGTSKHIATGSYDGIVRLWDQSGAVKHQLSGHSAAVKSISWLSNQKFVSGGRDAVLLLWQADPENESAAPKVQAMLEGHTSSVDAIAYHAKSNQIVSGSADTTLRVWTGNYKELPEAEDHVQEKSSTNSTTNSNKSTASQKRRKVAKTISARSRGSLATLSGHTKPVTGVVFHSSDSNVVYSVAQDHSLKTWDLTTGALVDSKVTSFPLLSVANMGPTTGLIACGSSARHITLIDPRTTTTTSQTQLVGHHNFVVSLAPSPHSPYQLCSGSHDGTARIWDIRAQKSLYVINRESGQKQSVFGVDWDKEIGIASVGQDKQLQINSTPQ